jgi:HTH-type transcriptional regulator/antitoxin HigA
MAAAAKELATEALHHWKHVAPALTTPRSEEDCERLVAILDEVLDAGGDDEDSPLATLAERIGDLIGDYEAEHHRVPDADPITVLRFLMEQHELKQTDLPEIGAQSVVSAVLSGKRQLNLRQVAALSRRFGVSADAFIAQDEG